MWPMLAMAALGAVQGDQQRRQQEKANQAAANASAAQMEFSPWTGMKPSAPQFQAVTGGALGGAVKGGLTGAMYGKGAPSTPTDAGSMIDAEKERVAAGGQVDPLNFEQEDLLKKNMLSQRPNFMRS